MDIITRVIVEICSNGQQLLSILIYGVIGYQTYRIISESKKHKEKIENVDEVIKLIKQPNFNISEELDFEKTELVRKENEQKLETITSNFPIMVKEIKDVYNKKKPKQISAVDLFENNLVIPSHVEANLRSRINSLTALGLLGTFIGLISSILKISPEQTTDGITALIASIGPAIATTIAGVIASLCTSRYFTNVKTKYKETALKLEEEMMSDKPADTNPDYFYDSFTSFAGEKYEIALSKIVDNFLEKMKESLKKDLEDYSKVINDATNNLSESEAKFTVAASDLEGTVSTINTYLQETDKLNKNFEQKLGEFTVALDSFNEKFRSSKEATTEVLNNIDAINNSNKEINNTLFTTLQSELDEIKKSFELMKEMNYSFKNEIMNTPLQLDASIKNLCNDINELTSKLDSKANSALSDLSTKLVELGNYLENIKDDNRE